MYAQGVGEDEFIASSEGPQLWKIWDLRWTLKDDVQASDGEGPTKGRASTRHQRGKLRHCLKEEQVSTSVGNVGR